MKVVDIVAPVYGEELVIEHFDRALRAVLTPLSARYRFHIVYVLDPSPDKSFDILLSILSRVDVDGIETTVLHLSRRFGHQMSLVAGIDHSTGDAVIMMDTDLQHPPNLIPEFLRKFEEGFDIVQALRTYGEGISWFKRTPAQLFYRLQRRLSPVSIENGSADFRLISRRVASVFQRSIREHNQFLRGLFSWVGFPTCRVEFVSPPRSQGETHYNFLRLLEFFGDGIVSFSRVPLRVATLAGALMAALSAVYAIYLLEEFIRRRDLPQGYPSIILSMLFIGGLQLLVCGVIGEYIGHIFDEVKRRPLYLVEQVVNSGSQELVPSVILRSHSPAGKMDNDHD